MRKRYSLQIAISTLFIFIAIILGLVLSWQSFNKTSDIMLKSADEIYARITHELTLDFKITYGSLAGGLRQFRLSPVIQAATFEQRIAYLPAFQAVLESDLSVFSVGVGYADGDYLGFSTVHSDYVSEKYKVPAGSSYIAFYVKGAQENIGEPTLSETRAFEAGNLYTIFYDEKLNEISRNPGETTQFDPRNRPWYQQASEIPYATKPYLFYDSKVVGLSIMSKTTEPGVVVVFDVTLENLSDTIAKYQVTPHSEVVLINAEGQAFAYKDQQKVIVKNSDLADSKQLQLATLKQLGSDVLSYFATFIAVEEQDLDFNYDGQRWIGSTRIVAKPGGVDLYALMLSPVDELLLEAVTIRKQLMIITLFILLLFIPVIWYVSKKISAPLHDLAAETETISRFDFSITQKQSSLIKEVAELDAAIELMKSTINKFIKLINSLAGEQNFDALVENITQQTMLISQSDAALIYLMDEQEDTLKAVFMCDSYKAGMNTNVLPSLSIEYAASLLNATDGKDEKSFVIGLSKNEPNKLTPVLEVLGEEAVTAIVLPLKNRNNEIIGLLCLMHKRNTSSRNTSSRRVHNIEFIEALSGFAAVTLESRQSYKMQEALLHSFIKLIAGAIDAKSPYTAGHCQRVPEITLMLAKAACASNDDKFKHFSLDDKEWEELSIACWLHDCGKVTTPEYVVDKATKLETIYDRIHEIRTRFEVLKRDAEISCWQQIADGADKAGLLDDLAKKQQQLDDEFAFIAECNVGGEFMAEDKVARLRVIAAKTWQRTLDDKLGLSWEELNRKGDSNDSLPVTETLLADKTEHLIERHEVDKMPPDNQWGFKVDTPVYKYNRGELYNLSVQRGTLNEEERYMINGHMIQTIIMLNNLPYPKALRNVPLIAGSHHETMDGKGYPKRLVMSEQPSTARMMVIADIFEALTASDRPYKKAKTLTESLRILAFMRDDKHIDADLFELFLQSGVYLDYAKQFLEPEQIDEVNIEDYLF